MQGTVKTAFGRSNLNGYDGEVRHFYNQCLSKSKNGASQNQLQDSYFTPEVSQINDTWVRHGIWLTIPTSDMTYHSRGSYGVSYNWYVYNVIRYLHGSAICGESLDLDPQIHADAVTRSLNCAYIGLKRMIRERNRHVNAVNSLSRSRLYPQMADRASSELMYVLD